MAENNKLHLTTIASYLLTAGALLIVLYKGLLAALFSGLLVYSLVHVMSPPLSRNISDHRARMIAVILLGSVIVLVLSLAIWGGVSFFSE